MKDSLQNAAERADAERRLTAMVFEQLPDGLVVVDARLHVMESNARFAKMIGVSAPAGRALYDLLRHRDLYELFETTLKSRETAERIVRLADDLVWQVTVVTLPEGARAAAVGVLRDVTRLERTESMRRTFVGDVSHELRTPIASIAAAAETLAEGGTDEADTAQLLDLIRRQSERMRELIDDLMDLAQIESGAVELRKEELSLTELVREVARDLASAAASREIRIAVDANGDIPVAADRRRLGQIIRNLLDNAVKFSREGATVRVYAGRDGGRRVLFDRRRRARNPARRTGEDLSALLPDRPFAIEDAPGHGAGPRDRQAPRAAARGPDRPGERGRQGKHVPRATAPGLNCAAAARRA